MKITKSNTGEIIWSTQIHMLITWIKNEITQLKQNIGYVIGVKTEVGGSWKTGKNTFVLMIVYTGVHYYSSVTSLLFT